MKADYIRAKSIDFRAALQHFPRGLRILLVGTLVRSIGMSIIWPFLTVYVRENLLVSLATVTLLLAVRSVTGMVSTSIAGVVVDRFGRKWAMALTLSGLSLVFVAMAFAQQLWLWALLMAFQGLLGSTFMIGEQAAVADFVKPERRSDAYALLRVVRNTGIALGPSIGALLVTISYTLAFLTVAFALLLAALLVALLVPETLVVKPDLPGGKAKEYGYQRILTDYPFLVFCGVYSLIPMTAMILFTLAPVYMKEQYGLAESNFGVMMTVNAAMVVLFEFWMTRFVKRFPPARVLAVGAMFYALSMVMMIIAGNFPLFLLAMVVITIGEITVMPNAISFVANLAPADMRGRYLGVQQLAGEGGMAIGPLIGGLLNDHIAPVAMWYGAALMSWLAMTGFLVIAARAKRKRETLQPDVVI